MVDQTVQVIVLVKRVHRAEILRKSGLQGMFTRPFYEKQEDNVEFRNVPLPLSHDLDSAQRVAVGLGDRAFGVLPKGKGYAVRVRTQNYEEVVKQYHSETDAVRFLGTNYVVKGCPMSWDEQDCRCFFEGIWDVHVAGSRRIGRYQKMFF
eukprot:590178-Karenia_brevis.AAC.1